MKQRLSVRAIITQEDKVLVLKRANGRASILGNFELPGGKLAYGEQPEDALRRYLHDDAGVHIKTAQLFDAVTYIDHDDRDIQYAVMVYIVSLADEARPIKLSGNYSKYRWQPMSEIQQDDTTDLTQLILGIVHQEELSDETLKSVAANDVKDTSENSITIFTDGGSRGNPGPSAAGFVILNHRQEVIEEGGEYLGITTNNQAEYKASVARLELAKSEGVTKHKMF